jgi:hypothetical protein
MFNSNLADVGAKHVDNPKIYNIERDNRLSPGLQHLTTRYRVENPFLIIICFLYRKLS